MVTTRTLLVIPAHNEEESIGEVIDEIRRELPTVDFVIVNDGSSDQTVAICQQKEARYIDLPVNLGLSGAFETGMKYARDNDYDCVIQFDGDGQHMPVHIPELIATIENGADLAIGSRFVTEKKPVSARMLGNTLISFAIKMTTGKTSSDPTSGLRAFSKKLVGFYLNTPNMTPEPDTVSYLIKCRANVGEVQVAMRERTAGESYLTFSRSVKYMLRMTISIFILQFFRERLDLAKGGSSK